MFLSSRIPLCGWCAVWRTIHSKFVSFRFNGNLFTRDFIHFSCNFSAFSSWICFWFKFISFFLWKKYWIWQRLLHQIPWNMEKAATPFPIRFCVITHQWESLDWRQSKSPAISYLFRTHKPANAHTICRLFELSAGIQIDTSGFQFPRIQMHRLRCKPNAFLGLSWTKRKIIGIQHFDTQTGNRNRIGNRNKLQQNFGSGFACAVGTHSQDMPFGWSPSIRIYLTFNFRVILLQQRSYQIEWISCKAFENAQRKAEHRTVFSAHALTFRVDTLLF